MLKQDMMMIAAVLSLGVAGYQAFAVKSGGEMKIKVTESITPDEVKKLADSLTVTPDEHEEFAPAPRPAADAGELPLERSGGFVAVPQSVKKGVKATSAKKSSASKASKAAAKAPKQKRQKESLFKKASSAVSKDLSKNFYTKTDFGFNPKVKKSTTGNRTRRVSSQSR